MRHSKTVLSALAASALMIISAAPDAAAATAVTWTGVVNASASGSTLTKTSGCSTCFDAGGASQQGLSSGSIVFAVTGGKELVVGLGRTATIAGSSIDYAFHFYTNGAWDIRELGVYKTEGASASGDQYTISLAGGVVTYLRNGSVVYTSRTAASGTYVMDSSLQSIGAAVQSAQVSSSSTTTSSTTSSTTTTSTSSTGGAVGWKALVNASASGSTVTKTSGCDTCSDAGGLSQQQLTTGSFSFSVPAGQRLRVGIGQDTSNSTSNVIDYSFQFYGSSWDIRESGVYKTEGASASGDTYTISVDSTGVKYYRNGSLVYRSTVAPASTLVVHASLESIGSAVQNASVSGSVSSTSSTTSTSSTSTSSTTSTTSTTSTAKNLRVLQWNTHHGGYGTDGVYDPDRLATWAASFKPDVVMFNEIEKNDSWGNQDQPEVYKSLLQQKTGKTWYYVFAQEFGNWTANGKGNLILSTYPIQVSDRYELVNNYDRSAALAQITVNTRDITLMLTHLDPYDATLRLTQATEVTSWAAGQPENRIITGDMNAWPDQTSIAQFDSLYKDSWAVAAANGTATAFSGNNGETKNGRIDYIFYSNNALNLSVVSSQVYDTRDANGVMPSDHRPVLTVFSVR